MNVDTPSVSGRLLCACDDLDAPLTGIDLGSTRSKVKVTQLESVECLTVFIASPHLHYIKVI